MELRYPDTTTLSSLKLTLIRDKKLEIIFYDEGVKTLEQVAQRSGTCPTPANIPGQVGQGFE